MYAADRVFAAAPPLYVVGLLLQLWWLPVQLLRFTGWQYELIQHGRDVSTAMVFVGAVLLIGASGELVRRSHGRVRVGMLLTFWANVLVLALVLSRMYVMLSDRELFQATIEVFGWINVIGAVIGVVGLAIAAGRGSLVTSSIVVVATVLVETEQVHAWVYQIGGGEFLFWFSVALAPLRILLLVAMVAAIAKQCSEPVRDHRRASRRFSVLAWLFAVRAMFACVMIEGAHGSNDVQLWLVGGESLVLAAIVMAMWGIAQTQLPKLPRFSLHVAMAGVLISVFLLAQVTEAALHFEDGVFHRRFYVIDTWQLATAAIGGAVWVVALWRYSKHAPAIKRSVALGALVFAAAIGYELLVEEHLWLCELIASAALIPAFRATAIALADDPVQTTADVFG